MGDPGTKPSGLINAIVLVLVLAVLGWVVWQLKPFSVSTRDGLGEGFEDPTAVAAIDPKLLIYDEAPRLSLELGNPSCLAVGPGDRIYVAGDKALYVADPDGRPAWRTNLGENARCVAVATNGTIYLGMGNHVEVLDATGAHVASWEKASADALFVSIATDGENVFASDATGLSIVRYDKTGRVTGRFDKFIMFGSPCFDVAVDPGGNLWAANPGGRELRKYGKDAEIVSSWRRVSRGIDGFSGCCNPVHIAFRPDGAFVTTEMHVVRVKVVAQSGELVGVVAGPEAFTGGIGPADAACDSAGRVLLLDATARAIRVFVEKRKP